MDLTSIITQLVGGAIEGMPNETAQLPCIWSMARKASSPPYRSPHSTGCKLGKG